jgi:leucyl-tRNA synthetase
MKIIKIARTKKNEPDAKTLAEAKAELRQNYKTQFANLLREAPTYTEKRMIDLLTEGGIPFRFQVGILGYIVDFYFKAAKSILEVDGGIHKERIDYDRRRDKAFRDAGFRVLRINDKRLIDDTDGVLAEVRAYLRNGRGIVKRERKKRQRVTRWQDVPKLTKDNLKKK